MKNQLLLLEDVHNVGRKGDLVKVKPGFARNYLIPKQIAFVADRSVVKIQAKLKEERAKQSIIDKKVSEEMAEKLKHVSITHEVKVDADGHMYGSVSAQDIVNLLKEEGIEIERRMVSIDHSIKQTGAYSINLKLREGVMASFHLKIVSEDGEIVTRQAVAHKPEAASEEKS
jgi:large subunit ribosomal protein L9